MMKRPSNLLQEVKEFTAAMESSNTPLIYTLPQGMISATIESRPQSGTRPDFYVSFTSTAFSAGNPLDESIAWGPSREGIYTIDEMNLRDDTQIYIFATAAVAPVKLLFTLSNF